MLGQINGNEFDIATFTSETATITKEMLGKDGLGLVDFNPVDEDGKPAETKYIELICSPVKFDAVGSDNLKELFETMLNPDINVDLAFNTFFKEFIDSFWNKLYKDIFIMLTLTRIIPLVNIHMLMLYPLKWMFYVSLVIASFIFLYELRSLCQLGYKKHFESFMNYVDFIGHLSGIVWISYMIKMDFTCHENDDSLSVCVF